MRETPHDPSRARNRRLLWTGAALLVIGLSLVLVVGEWFAMLDACVANPTCTGDSSADTLQGLLGLQVLGVTLAIVAGALWVSCWCPTRAGPESLGSGLGPRPKG